VRESHTYQPASANGTSSSTNEDEGEGPDQFCDQLSAHDLFSMKWLGM
jgi:hypothetical protein